MKVTALTVARLSIERLTRGKSEDQPERKRNADRFNTRPVTYVDRRNSDGNSMARQTNGNVVCFQHRLNQRRCSYLCASSFTSSRFSRSILTQQLTHLEQRHARVILEIDRIRQISAVY